MAPTDTYIQHAETIEWVLGFIKRRHRLSTDAGDEFSSWVRLRLLEDDSAILRRFEGRSSARTFLITVIQRLFLDWRNREWGKWRPSAEARRSGPLAIELERLVLRDQIEFDQAVDSLVSRGTAHSHAECDAVWAKLPRRPARRAAGDEGLGTLPAPTLVDDATIDEMQNRAQRATAALSSAIPKLSPREQLMIRLRYDDGFTVARIAKLLGEEQKPLYREFDLTLAKLRAAVESMGVMADDLREVFGSPVVEFGSAIRSTSEGTRNSSPSLSSGARGKA